MRTHVAERRLAELVRTADHIRGISWIYRLMDDLLVREGLDDVVIVLEDRHLGRQVFRAGQRPLDGDRATGIAQQADAGIYTSPPDRGLSANEETVLLRLCELMFELEVAGRLASRDELTALGNRRSFDQALERAAQRARRYGWSFSLVVVDLDGLKRLNDQRGHPAGDRVLQAVGGTLRRHLRAGDVAARIGGDEFALILEDTARSTVPDVLTRVRDELRDLPDGPIEISAGAASWPQDAEDGAELYEIADSRLYAEKERAR